MKGLEIFGLRGRGSALGFTGTRNPESIFFMAGKKILVADDSLTIQKVIRLALSGDGYEILTVSDGAEAIEQMSLFRPHIAIIDVSLPKSDAYQVREYLISKPDLINIPTIMMSSAFERVDETRMRDLGFSGHLIKPFDPAHLRSTLASVSMVAPALDPIMDTISVQTPNAMGDDGFSGFEMSTLDGLPQDLDFVKPEPLGLPPIPQITRGGNDLQTLTQSTFDQDFGAIEAIDLEPTPVVNSSTTTKVGGNRPVESVAHVSLEDIRSIVRAEIDRALAELREEISGKGDTLVNHYVEHQLPGLAERVIKDEISRLLSEPPV